MTINGLVELMNNGVTESFTRVFLTDERESNNEWRDIVANCIEAGKKSYLCCIAYTHLINGANPFVSQHIAVCDRKGEPTFIGIKHSSSVIYYGFPIGDVFMQVSQPFFSLSFGYVWKKCNNTLVPILA